VVSDINGERLLADLRALAAIGGLPDGGVDRLAWSEHDLAGRRWFSERMSEAGIEARVDAALNVFGHLPGTTGPWLLTGSHLDSILEAQQHRDSIKAFLELHIEQGPRMEADKIDLAVVTGIVGVHRQRIEIQGTQNHAGTTPFRLRHDAGRAAARAAAELRDLVQSVDAEAVANIGSMRFHPGGVNVIPGRAQFTLE